VENIGDEEQQVFGEEQKLIDDRGREHTHDAGATIAANDEGGGDLWIGNINPGDVIKGDIVYDIPKNAKPVEVQLRGLLFRRRGNCRAEIAGDAQGASAGWK